MTSTEVVELYAAWNDCGIEVWIDGGWAVDALLGKQTRPHDDLDIAVGFHNVRKLRTFLASCGYRDVDRNNVDPWNFILVGRRGEKIDIHVVVFDEQGHVAGGIAYPDGSLSGAGVIDGRTVRCIAPEYLVAFRTQYEPREKDRQDVAALCERFDLENPLY